MATIYRRGQRWRAEVYCNEQRESATFRTRQEAAQWALEREGELTHGRRGNVPVHTLHEALVRFRTEVSPKRKGHHWESLRLGAWMRSLPFVGQRIDRITTEDIGRFRNDRLKVVKGSTVRRELNLLGTVFEEARREWGWLSVNPIRGVRKPPPSKPRSREFTADEVKRIVEATGYKGKVKNLSHQTAVALLFAIETAMRAGEICSLSPAQVRGRVAHLEETKNGDSRDVPLSKEALRLWKLLPHGFTITPRQLDALFRKYRNQAKVSGVTFHDSRRTAIGRLAKKLDVMQLAKMTGHRDLKILLSTYYAPKAQEVARLLG